MTNFSYFAFPMTGKHFRQIASSREPGAKLIKMLAMAIHSKSHQPNTVLKPFCQKLSEMNI
jgi:hypothetical protein